MPEWYNFSSGNAYGNPYVRYLGKKFLFFYAHKKDKYSRNITTDNRTVSQRTSYMYWTSHVVDPNDCPHMVHSVRFWTSSCSFSPTGKIYLQTKWLRKNTDLVVMEKWTPHGPGYLTYILWIFFGLNSSTKLEILIKSLTIETLTTFPSWTHHSFWESLREAILKSRLRHYGLTLSQTRQ